MELIFSPSLLITGPIPRGPLSPIPYGSDLSATVVVKLQALLFHANGQLEGVLPSTSLGEAVHQGLRWKMPVEIHGQVSI